ncbi:uncharacterized protein SOCE26_013760 [Sorangium cellulosum]|uniref:HTH lysR-type domain-containing protein n=1 Tax=Sorangium cellulosum TaxID=56 RepID=A0A2L0EL10_SORCE|nr:uncharacterized protein SOCE26_013760 [Sorangium cellulosum]
MDVFSEIGVFKRVVDARSFTRAGQQLGLTPSGVSRVVSRLEERLGVRLLNRTTRSISLTDDGAAYYERCQKILAELEDANLAMARAQRAEGPPARRRPARAGRLHARPGDPLVPRGVPRRLARPQPARSPDRPDRRGRRRRRAHGGAQGVRARLEAARGRAPGRGGRAELFRAAGAAQGGRRPGEARLHRVPLRRHGHAVAVRRQDRAGERHVRREAARELRADAPAGGARGPRADPGVRVLRRGGPAERRAGAGALRPRARAEADLRALPAPQTRRPEGARVPGLPRERLPERARGRRQGRGSRGRRGRRRETRRAERAGIAGAILGTGAIEPGEDGVAPGGMRRARRGWRRRGLRVGWRAAPASGRVPRRPSRRSARVARRAPRRPACACRGAC